MCQYKTENKCLLTNTICPWAYWCGAISGYKQRESYRVYCKILKDKIEQEKPDGYYKVNFERHGYLYINFNNEIIKVKNPFEDIPKFVKVKKTKTSCKLTK